MTGHRSDPAVESYVASARPGVQAVLRELLALVRQTLPEAEETIKWGRPVFSGGRDVCYLAKAREHATLGFYGGAELDDPAGILEGTGRKLRHVKVGVGADIPRSTLESFLRAAWDASVD